MADDNLAPETTHFGLTRVASGEPWSKNGWAFSDLDRTTMDQLFYAMATHVHDGSPALGDPSDPPTLVGNATGGQLPAATTYYYRCSFVDEHGLESAASTEVSVTTPDPIDPPTAPSCNVETSTGTLIPGVYAYLITFTDNYGGETTPSSLASAQVVGTGPNRIRIDLPDLATGTIGINIYRARPGQAQFYSLGSSTTGVFYDDGSIVEDQTITAPTINSTNASTSVDVTIPGGFIPLGCLSWRIYRATSAGGYDGNSLVHEVAEGGTDTSTSPVLTWTDTGDELQAGFPKNTSQTLPHGSLLTLNQVQGTLPLSAMARGSQSISAYAPGTMTDGTTFLMTDSVTDVEPVRLTAYFSTAPTDVGVTVNIQVTDSVGTTVSLPCDPTQVQPGDPAGYFHTNWPLVAAAEMEAETGTTSDNTVTVDNDPAAPSGEAMTLGTTGQWTQVSMGVLEKGIYSTFATVRALAFGTVGSGNDLHVQVVNNAGTVLGETSYNLTQHSPPTVNDYLYQEIAGPVITAPGSTELFIRVKKVSTTDTTSYDVDSMRYSATVPVLTKGALTFSIGVTGGTSSAANANVVLWF